MAMPPLVIQATQRHTATIIWLHGLGDTGAGWRPAMPIFRMPWAKFILPTAPVQPVTMNMGMSMTSWYDIKGLAPNEEQDEVGLERSRKIVEEIVRQEIANGIPSHRLVLAGFSQGGVMALLTGLRFGQRLGGIVGVSCYLPLAHTFPKAIHEANHHVPVLLCHQTDDPLVQYSFGQRTSTLLKESSEVPVEWRSYQGGGHGVSDQELLDIGAFLRRVLPERDDEGSTASM